MIDNTSITIITDSSSYLLDELFKNWRGNNNNIYILIFNKNIINNSLAFNNPTTIMMAGRVIQVIIFIGSNKKYQHMMLESFNSIVSLHYSSKQSIPIVIYTLPFFQQCSTTILYCHFTTLISTLLILINKWDIGLQVCFILITIIILIIINLVMLFRYPYCIDTKMCDWNPI
jgi:hypothetical protein